MVGQPTRRADNSSLIVTRTRDDGEPGRDIGTMSGQLDAAASAEQSMAGASARTRAVMRGNRRVNTLPEMALRRALHRSGFRFRVDMRIVVPGRKVRPDIVFTRHRLAVFVDGCFWHGCPEHFVASKSSKEYWTEKLRLNLDRDRQVNEALTAAGWTVLRIWAHVAVADAECMVRKALSSNRLATGTPPPLLEQEDG